MRHRQPQMFQCAVFNSVIICTSARSIQCTACLAMNVHKKLNMNVHKRTKDNKLSFTMTAWLMRIVEIRL